MKTVYILEVDSDVLIVEANIILRNRNLSLAHAEAWNSLFRQLTGEDHESMVFRKDATAVDK